MDVIRASCILLFAHFVGADYPWYVDSTHWSVECPPWNGELVFLADPTDCAKYYACTPSGPVHYDCPSELWWDTTQDICNWPNEVKCKANCPDPWIVPEKGSGCFLHSNESMNFFEAEEFCLKQGGYLAEPRSKSDTKTVASLLPSDQGFNFWIGLTDYCEEGKFKWKSDGSEVTEYKNWQKYQPDNTDENEDCVHIDKENQWNDRRCLSRETASGDVMTALCQR